MITIYDIAKECGFAPTTVSKTLNGYQGVNENTRAKILDTALKLGYQPNIAARSLITKRSYNIGVVIYIKDTVDLTHFLFIKILNKFKNVLDQHGYDITIISKEDNNLNKQAFINHCRMRRVDGIFLFGDFTSSPFQEILESEIPAIGFDYYGDKIDSVTSDNYEATKNLTQYLISLGHRDILYLSGSYNYVTERRAKGFTDAITEAGLTFSADMVRETAFYNPGALYEETKRILSGDKKYSAIIFPDDYSAVGGMRALKEAGLKVPRDISVASFDGIEFSELTTPALTTVRQDTEKIGEALAHKLLSVIENKAADKEKLITVIPSCLVKTESCRKID